MKTILFFMAILVLSFQSANAGLLDFFGDEEEKPVIHSPKKSNVPNNKVCHFSILVKGESQGQSVHYIFRGPCGKFAQVGIVDDFSKVIIDLENLKITSKTEYYGKNRKLELIKERWNNITPIHFFEN
jgi:hypothetical protein